MMKSTAFGVISVLGYSVISATKVPCSQPKAIVIYVLVCLVKQCGNKRVQFRHCLLVVRLEFQHGQAAPAALANALRRRMGVGRYSNCGNASATPPLPRCCRLRPSPGSAQFSTATARRLSARCGLHRPGRLCHSAPIRAPGWNEPRSHRTAPAPHARRWNFYRRHQ